MEICRTVAPRVIHIGEAQHQVSCHLYDDVAAAAPAMSSSSAQLTWQSRGALCHRPGNVLSVRRWYALTASLLGALLLGVQGASAQAQQPPLTASADLRDASGNQVATASLLQAADQVQITFSFPNTGALSGTHAVHIHEHGSCSGTGFADAGGIFNPFGKQHGLLNPAGPMAGDLPDLTLGTTGLARYNLAAPLVTLRPGPASLLNPNGTALVIDSGS